MKLEGLISISDMFDENTWPLLKVLSNKYGRYFTDPVRVTENWFKTELLTYGYYLYQTYPIINNTVQTRGKTCKTEVT